MSTFSALKTRATATATIFASALLISGLAAAPAMATGDPAPLNLEATAGIGSVTLSWQAPFDTPDVNFYEVDMSTDGENFNPITSGDCLNVMPQFMSDSATCTQTELTTGQPYYFKVAVSDGNDPPSPISDFTDPVESTPFDLPAPATVSAIAGDASIVVNWDAVTSDALTGYSVVYYQDSMGPSYPTGDSSCGVLSTSTATTTCTLSGLTNGSSYEVRVAAIAGETLGDYTAANPVTPQGEVPTPPDPPTVVSAVAGAQQVVVSWTAPDGSFDNYAVQYTITNGSSWISPATGDCVDPTSVATTCTLTGLTNGVSVQVRVATVAGDQYSGYTNSNTVTPAPVLVAPGTPTNLATYKSQASAVVTWDAPSDNGGSAITGYSVQVAQSPSGAFADAAGSCATTGTAKTCTATGLANGTSYVFQVAAINIVGTSSYTAASSPVVPQATALPAALATKCPSGSCAGANLVGVDLNGADLSGVDFSGANLVGANLSGAKLTGANLSRANLVTANLRNALLVGANLTRANLVSANASGANMRGANLSSANTVAFARVLGTRSLRATTKTNFSKANLRGANLAKAKFVKTNFSHARMAKARLTKANLTGAIFKKANLQRARAQGANFTRANFTSADLRKTDFRKTKRYHAIFKHAKIKGLKI